MSQPAQEKIPDWIDNAFLSRALQSYRNDSSIVVSSFSTNSSFSEHFASSMFQSKIEYSSKRFPKPELETINVVIKAKPECEGIKKRVVESAPLFQSEIRMYKEGLPAMHRLFERSGMKIQLGPELIFAENTPVEVIILKDMSSEGFSSPRTPFEELDDAKLLIKQLAQFHAASYYLTETNEFDFSEFNMSMFEDADLIKGFYESTMFALKDAMKTWDGYEQYIPLVDNFIKNFVELGVHSYVANKPGRGYNVLNHGDFHTRNLLVKMNENKRVEKFFFIDFQTNIYCSPALDMSYMCSIAKRDENGEIPIEELTMFYHQEFTEALKAFGFMKAPPSLLDLNVEIMKHGFFEVLMGMSFIPFCFIDWDKMTAEDLMGEGEDKDFKRKLFDIPLCRQLLQKEIKSWVYKGWL